MGVRLVVHARTQIDQSLWPFDQCREDIGGEHVDREDVRQTIDRDVVAFPIADGGIVDDRVEAAERVDLVGDDAGLGRICRANVEIPQGETAAGRTDIELPWEQLNKVDELKAAV